jgi:hypothetical protein
MSEARILLDPTARRDSTPFERATRPGELDGLTIGLLDITKPRGDVFFERLEALLADRGARIERFSKPTFTKPAPADLCHEMASRCDAVIEALAD